MNTKTNGPVAKLKNVLSETPKTVQQICEETGLSQPQVTSILTNLHARSIVAGDGAINMVKIPRTGKMGRKEVKAYHR